MRVVSLLPSGTEILFALSLDKEIAGVSHECDFPGAARSKPVVIQSRIPTGTPPLEIDRMVRDFVSRAESLYAVDADLLERLSPDLIVTQDLCHVCAASPDDLAAALARFERPPEVLCLNPQTLGDVWRDILWVGEETCNGARAERLVEQIGQKLAVIEQQVHATRERPRVAFLEWLQPFYVGGHWVPEMIEIAGGRDVLGKPGTPSFRVTMEEIIDAAPELIVVAPCGYSAEQARDEYRSLRFPDEWHAIPAVRNGQVFALEANSYFSRPGPRLVTGVEILARVFHPSVAVHPQSGPAVLRVATAARAARAFSA